MKRLSLSILSLIMVMAILVNTAGITVYNHFCSSEGESSLFFVKKDNCCEKKEIKTEKHGCCASKKGKEAPAKKKGCCSQDAFTAQWKINEFSIQKNVLIAAPEMTLPFSYTFLTPQISAVVITSEFSSPPFVVFPIDILHRNAVLII